MIFINILESVCLALEEEEKEEIVREASSPGHPDCENCPKSVGETCTGFRTCAEWREWFSYEWNGIRKAAERMKGKAK